MPCRAAAVHAPSLYQGADSSVVLDVVLLDELTVCGNADVL